MNYAFCCVDFGILKKVPSDSLVSGQENTGIWVHGTCFGGEFTVT